MVRGATFGDPFRERNKGIPQGVALWHSVEKRCKAPLFAPAPQFDLEQARSRLDLEHRHLSG